MRELAKKVGWAARVRRRRSGFNLHLQEDPGWERRAQEAVELLVPWVSDMTSNGRPVAIADLGCGNERLASVLAGRLSAPFTYHGYDVRPQSQRVVKLDVQQAVPEGRFDVAFALGLLEYLRDVGDFAKRLRSVSRFAVVSYVLADRGQRWGRRAIGWRSSYDRPRIEALWMEHGWHARGFAMLPNGTTGLWLWELSQTEAGHARQPDALT